uniref:Putative ABC transporter n=1 Tax=Chryseobacterium sp. Stok-2 TaxID=1620219 RepID=A0A0C5L3B0_9FLAO|nr:putative ABC transporter [Chryseobacterium sp. Stok-2]
MNFNKRILKLKRRERLSKFGFNKEIPPSKIFRRSNDLFWLILIASLVLLCYIYRTNNSDKAYETAMGVVVFSICVFGYFVKFILILFFPELILNEKGVKFFGRKLVNWKEIKKIKINYSGNSKLIFVITKNNSKKISEYLNLSNVEELRFFARSFMKKYRLKNLN